VVVSVVLPSEVDVVVTVDAGGLTVVVEMLVLVGPKTVVVNVDVLVFVVVVVIEDTVATS
jgi:hypothetical protein